MTGVTRITRVTMFFVKHLKFFHLFIFGKISQQNVFDIILESKKSIFRQKKIRIFPKGLVHGFGKNINSFHLFIVG